MVAERGAENYNVSLDEGMAKFMSNRMKNEIS